MYTALKPKYHSAGFFTEFNKRGEQVKVEYYNVTWTRLGLCTSVEDARQRYGGRPVLQQATKESISGKPSRAPLP